MIRIHIMSYCIKWISLDIFYFIKNKKTGFGKNTILWPNFMYLKAYLWTKEYLWTKIFFCLLLDKLW